MEAGSGAAACLPGCSAEMGPSVAGQAAFFGGAVLLGGAVGVLYDMFRVIRVRIGLRAVGAVLDLLFWTAATAALFVYAVTAGDGEVRVYMILGVLAGAAVYFALLSRWILRLGYLAADFVGLVWGIVTLPLRAILLLYKKIGKKAKKFFH